LDNSVRARRANVFFASLWMSSAMASSSGGVKTLWFTLKGEDPGMVTIDVNSNIFQLKKSIHSEYPNKLAGVDSGMLKIYLKQGDAEAMNPMKGIPENDKDDEGTPIPFYVHYEEQVEHAAKRARLVEVEEPLTAETARLHVERGVKSGKYKAPALPEGYTEAPLHREEACRIVQKYIKAVRAKTNKGPDGKFPMLGCSGMKGIGKTAMLVHGARVLVPELEQDPSVKAVYMTFNGGGAHTKVFCKSLKRPGCEKDFDDAFGHMLMACCGVELDVEQCLNFDVCLGVCRSLLGLGDGGTVVCFVDEIGDLKEQCTPALLALMAQMDKLHGKLAFVFAHIRQDVLNEQQTASGRRVIPMTLPALPLDVWKVLLKGTKWIEAAAKHPGLHQLLLACCGHPRSLVDGLPAALVEVPNLLSDPSKAALMRARTAIVTECKFNDATDEYMAEVVPAWFNFVNLMDTGRLARDGLLITVNGKHPEAAVELLQPLVLQHWVHRKCELNSMAFHLQEAYDSDAVVGPDAEKSFEAIMYHYEAVLRLAVKGKVFTLRSFYQTSHVDPSWGAQEVTARVPKDTNLVVWVPDFSDMDNVLGFLNQGFLVVSRAHGEVGIEYLSPFVDVGSGKLIVAAVQCKFVNTKTDSWTNIKGKMLTAMAGLRKKNVQCFPVVYTTRDQCTINSATFADGVYFTESDLFAFTKKLGVLRLHCEKLGHNLAQTYSWLRRAGSGACDEVAGTAR